MHFRDWYTDTVDIFRVQEQPDGDLTRHERVLVEAAIPCRIYQTGPGQIGLGGTSSRIEGDDWLQCDNQVDIRAGDELLIHRGGALGEETGRIRGFASDPEYYFEPFGAVLPGLAHQEVRLLRRERVKK